MAANGSAGPPRAQPTVLDVNVFLIPGGSGTVPYILVEKGTAFYRMVHLLQIQRKAEAATRQQATMERQAGRPNVAEAYAHAHDNVGADPGDSESDDEDVDDDEDEDGGLVSAFGGIFSFFGIASPTEQPAAVPMHDAERGDAFHDRAQHPVVSTGETAVTSYAGDADVRRRGAASEAARDTYVVPIADQESAECNTYAADAPVASHGKDEDSSRLLTPVQLHQSQPPGGVVSEWFQVHYIQLWDVFILLRSMKQLDIGVISAMRAGAFGDVPSAKIDDWVDQNGYGILQYSATVHDTARCAIMARANMADAQVIQTLASQAESLAASEVSLFPTEGAPPLHYPDAGAGAFSAV